MASSLLESPDLTSTARPLQSTRLPTDSYVLSLASLPSCYAASSSAPSNLIELFDKTTLRHIQSFQGHKDATTSLKKISTIAGQTGDLLVSTGKDGSIKVWDGRSNSHSIKMTNLGQRRAILCCDVSADGFLVAGGTDFQGEDALILYWDPRQPAAPLRAHSETHSDDITSLHFSSLPSSKDILSASSDGLLSISNAMEDDGDDATTHVSNWGTSISQAGWIHSPSSGKAKIWAASDMETFSSWSDELDRLNSIDIREPSVHSGSRTWVTDYIISCQNIGDGFGVFVGSNEGDVALLSNSSLDVDHSPWTLNRLWTDQHAGVVRASIYDDQNNVLVTGGEDSKINVWPLVGNPSSESEPDAMEIDVSESPLRHLKRDIDWDESEQTKGKRARR